MKDIKVPVVPTIIAFVLVALVGVYMLVIRPAQREAQILKNWNSPAEAAKRGPGRSFGQSYDQQVQQLLQKERGNRALQKHRDRE